MDSKFPAWNLSFRSLFHRFASFYKGFIVSSFHRFIISLFHRFIVSSFHCFIVSLLLRFASSLIVSSFLRFFVSSFIFRKLFHMSYFILHLSLFLGFIVSSFLLFFLFSFFRFASSLFVSSFLRFLVSSFFRFFVSRAPSSFLRFLVSSFPLLSFDSPFTWPLSSCIFHCFFFGSYFHLLQNIFLFLFGIYDASSFLKSSIAFMTKLLHTLSFFGACGNVKL